MNLCIAHYLKKKIIDLSSGGTIIDEVLKQRLENKVYTWFKEINKMIAFKPDVILKKDPTASPTQCMFKLYINF